MKIVIAGAGEVGSHLAKLLSNEEQDIIVIDNDENRLALLENYNLMTILGSGISFKTLLSAGITRCDLFIAVTPYETQNVMACSIAKSLGAKKTVARIDNFEFIQPENKDYFTDMGVDSLIYPEFLAGKEIMTSLSKSWVRNWFELFGGELIVVGVKIRSNSSLVGKKLKEMGDLSRIMHVSAIKRSREIIIPNGDDSVRENDIVYIATTQAHISQVMEVCGKENLAVKKVLIMGGSRIAVQLARMAQNKHTVKIIEENRDRCEQLAQMLPYASIVHGDPRDTDLLEEEGVSDFDVFVALTESSEANILGCMMAKEHGVKKTIAEVENLQFINEAETLNIGTIINKKLLASSRIFQIMLDSDDTNSKCLALADAEVAEFVIKEGSKVTRSEVRNLRLPFGMTIAGLVRDGKGELVTGNTRLVAGDHVVVFCLSGGLHKIEKAFS